MNRGALMLLLALSLLAVPSCKRGAVTESSSVGLAGGEHGEVWAQDEASAAEVAEFIGRLEKATRLPADQDGESARLLAGRFEGEHQEGDEVVNSYVLQPIGRHKLETAVAGGKVAGGLE